MRRACRLLWALVAVVSVACAGSSGGDGREPGGRLLVLAAADLRFAFEELRPLFEGECACRVDIAFGSSGNFTTQIEQGLPGDVFFSANAEFIERLDARGLLQPGSKQLYAIGRIVLARNRSLQARVETLADLLQPAVRRIAIANPLHAPYGVAAREALQAQGLWQDVEPRLVLGENASQATQFVETGDAEAGILPLSLAIRLRHRIDYVVIDASLHSPLNQAAAVLRRSNQPELARALIAFVNGPRGREVMARYGFEPPV